MDAHAEGGWRPAYAAAAWAVAFAGHLALWDPWWILGGCLFALAGRAARRRRRVASSA